MATSLREASFCRTMMVPALRLAALLCFLAAPGAGEVVDVEQLAAEQPASDRLRPEAPSDEVERRCAPGRRVCIAEATFVEDVCRVIEEAAEAEGLDVGFFARLLWRESLFDAGAVSPAGALGIAQFMPATARLRGLADPFNPAAAILASADYLKELEQRFGSLGLAAVAYNAGEERAAAYLARERGLPRETQAYVYAITGHPAAAWREDGRPEPDLALDPESSFRETCLRRARSRNMPSFGELTSFEPGPEPGAGPAPEAEPEPPRLLPWGVILSAQDSQAATERQARQFLDSYGSILDGERVAYVHARVPGMAQTRHVAQVGRETRAEAEALCARLRSAGAPCMVLRN